MGAHIEPLLLDLANNVQISPQFTPLNANPHFKRAVQLAVDRAVREVCSPLVDRWLDLIALVTTDHHPCRRAIRHDCWHLYWRACRQRLCYGNQREQVATSWLPDGPETGWEPCACHLQRAIEDQPWYTSEAVFERTRFHRGAPLLVST